MRRAAVLAVIAVVLGGCTQIAGGGGYDLAEFSITGPDRLEAGAGTLTVSNSGEFPHTLVVTDSGGEVVAATSLLQPGDTVELGVELEEGRYSFTCRIVAEDGEGNLVDHFEAGMAAAVEVSE